MFVKIIFWFKLLNSAKGVIKEDITSEKLYGMITQSYKV